ncbi:MAG TPA: EamA family transporter [Anaerolineales bacterium]|nr:EamA family transporter [Anaerolineales bacterium]HRQ93272.1 EamA family transporter [Anaerolineales bacterium]
MQDKTQSQGLNRTGLANLLVVYLVWSSTYLAIRIAVREGAGFPPFTMGLMRAVLGSLILFTWSYLQKQRIRITRREGVVLAVSGLLLWVAGNGLVTFAEQRTESGLAALLVAASPIWAAVVEAIWDRKLPSPLLFVSLLIGFGGIVVLTLPSLSSGVQADTIATLALLAAATAWSTGSVYQARNQLTLAPRVSSAYQMLFGSIGFAILALVLKEPAPTPNTEAWLAWLYLVIFGTLAFTSYVVALKLLPTRIVMTYAYVNPVLAILLGYFVLGEEITAFTIGGSLLVLVGVAGVFRERMNAQKAARA